MDVTCQTEGGEAKVAIKGRFTFQDHTKFREVIAKVISADTQKLSIDLGQVEFIDSAGLGMLLLVREEMRNKSRDVVLRRAQGQVKRMFGIACFDTLFTIEQ
jgi:anti-anti-sigma factor